MPGKVAKIGSFSDWVGLFDDWRKDIGVNRDHPLETIAEPRDSAINL